MARWDGDVVDAQSMGPMILEAKITPTAMGANRHAAPRAEFESLGRAAELASPAQAQESPNIA